MDEKHKQEYIKNLPENRDRRLQDSLPTPYPFAIAIEITNDCNSNCFMCPRADMKRAKGNMSLEFFKKIIDELVENKVKLRKLFPYWMGEPLLNENFDKMINYAREKDIAEMIVLASNAISLDEDKAKRLIECKLDELFISLDAYTEETYRKIKGEVCTLKKVEENIKTMLRAKKEMNSSLPYVRLKFLKSAVNAKDAELFKQKWEPLVDEVYVEEDFNAWNGTNKRVNNNFDENIVNKNMPGNRWPCDRLWYQVSISQDGLVTPCIADWSGLGFIGDLKKKSLFEIWNSPEIIEMRKKQIEGRYDELPMCAKCNRWTHRNMGQWMIDNKERALSVCKSPSPKK